jgi:anti-sigma factor RsiW
VKCSDFLKELTDYLDNTMDPQTRAELEEHLQWCHNCYVVCNTTKSTIEIYRGSELYELPDDLRSRIHSAIIAKCKSHTSSPETAAPDTRAVNTGEKSS